MEQRKLIVKKLIDLEIPGCPCVQQICKTSSGRVLINVDVF